VSGPGGRLLGDPRQGRKDRRRRRHAQHFTDGNDPAEHYVGRRPAARELADGGGIAESSTLGRLLGDLEHEEHGGFAPRSVLVIDEAGDGSGSRVRGEIDAGGAFRGLAERLGAHELTANRRQESGWERYALALLRAGHAGEALDRYVEHGRVTVADTAAAARALLEADWWDASAAHLDATTAYVLGTREAQ